jgi:hypothetical protein
VKIKVEVVLFCLQFFSSDFSNFKTGYVKILIRRKSKDAERSSKSEEGAYTNIEASKIRCFHSNLLGSELPFSVNGELGRARN